MFSPSLLWWLQSVQLKHANLSSSSQINLVFWRSSASSKSPAKSDHGVSQNKELAKLRPKPNTESIILCTVWNTKSVTFGSTCSQFFASYCSSSWLLKGGFKSEDVEGFSNLQTHTMPNYHLKLFHLVNGNDKILIKFNILQVKKQNNYENQL